MEVAGMTVAERDRLQERVGELISGDATREWEISALEQKLAEEGFSFNTFDVRDAVWRLVERREAQFTVHLLVKAVAGS
jgi:hypothetical protein